MQTICATSYADEAIIPCEFTCCGIIANSARADKSRIADADIFCSLDVTCKSLEPMILRQMPVTNELSDNYWLCENRSLQSKLSPIRLFLFSNNKHLLFSKQALKRKATTCVRLKPRLHDTTGCQTRLTTGFDNRFDKRLYRVVKPVAQPGLTTG